MNGQIEPNLNHLKYFITAAETKNLYEAASLHRISQPAISLALKKLEEAFGIEILVRSKNRFKLTNEGEKLYQYAKEIFKRFEAIRDDLSKSVEEISGVMSLGTTMGVGPMLIQEKLVDFTKQYPKVNLKLSFGDLKTLYADLQSNRTELCVLMEDRVHPEFKRTVLHEGEFVAVIKNNKKSKTMKNNLYLTMDSPGVDEFLNEAKKKKSFQQELTNYQLHEVDNWEMIREMVRLGGGVGVLPDFMLEEGLEVVSELNVLASRLKYKVVLYHKGEHQLSRVGKAMVRGLVNP